MKYLAAISLTLLLLSGCSTTGNPTPSAPTTPAPSAVVTPNVPVKVQGVTSTVDLIKTLDAAGCDFAGVRASKNLARKNSATVEIACK